MRSAHFSVELYLDLCFQVNVLEGWVRDRVCVSTESSLTTSTLDLLGQRTTKLQCIFFKTLQKDVTILQCKHNTCTFLLMYFYLCNCILVSNLPKNVAFSHDTGPWTVPRWALNFANDSLFVLLLHLNRASIFFFFLQV